MKRIGLIPFHFGEAASEPLTKKYLDFYLWLTKCVTTENCEIITKNPKIAELTLAVSWQEYTQKPGITYSKILNRVRGWRGGVNVIIVDLAQTPDNFIPGQIEANMGQTINYICSTPKEHTPELFIVLLSQLPPEGEFVRHELQPAIDNGKVIIIDDFGETLFNNSFDIGFDSNQYCVQLASAREHPLALFKIKLIRRLGHFKKERRRQQGQCIRYFYDGSECERELVHLIAEHVNKEYPDKSPLLLYYREVSEWLRQPVIALAAQINSDFAHVEEFLEDPLRYCGNESPSPLIVFPLMDTGKTIELILRKWHEYDKIPKPNILSILSSKGHEIELGKRDIFIDKQKYVVKYLWKVDRKMRESSECEMCKLNIPKSNKAHEDYAMLTTYDMWALADEAGWIPEKDVPAKRSGLEIVPDFHKMIHKNGAWLAHKIRNRIEFSVRNFPAQPILILCPDEEGANAISVHLNVIQGFTIVRIPKSVINICIKETVDETMLDSKWGNDPWSVQLNSVSKTQHAIILEEFCVSGSTKIALINLAKLYGIEVLCHFALFNFNPKEQGDSSIPTYALYELQINLDEFSARTTT